MTGKEHLTKFINQVDDTLDEDYILELLNDAKDEVEEMALWEILKKSVEFTTTGSTNFETALGSLPSDFAEQVTVYDASDFQYDKIDFQDRYGKRNRAFGYFLDIAGDKIFLSGTNIALTTVTLVYKRFSPDITTLTEWVFPSRFHSILNYKMAELYYPSDAGEKGRSWDDRWSNQFERKLARMGVWDDRLKTVNKTPSRATRFNPRGLQSIRVS